MPSDMPALHGERRIDVDAANYCSVMGANDEVRLLKNSEETR